MNNFYITFLSLFSMAVTAASCGPNSDRHNLALHGSKPTSVRETSTSNGMSPSQPRGIMKNSQDFECLLGRLTWLGTLRVEFSVTGIFDENHNLGRVRIRRLPGAPTRYDVVQQSKINPSSSTMLSLELVHEDNAGYYESFVTVSNKLFTGPTKDFTVEGASPENFYEAKYVWRDLNRNESSGIGACYLAPAR